MKIAIYTIAKNESKFVEPWYESAKDADYLLIADTGSTDNTVELAKDLGINVFEISVSPWRFDDARNSALSLLPSDIDYCIALDMDEVLLPGWREELEKALLNGVTRPRYKYTWSWKSDGTPGLQYGADKIHARNGYRWKHPVHEVLVADRIEEKQGWYNIEIHHYPDNTKSRSQYLPLLKISVLEDPLNDRNAYYYARELFFSDKKEEAAKEFKRHLSLEKATWNPERAASLRYLAKCEPHLAKNYLMQAVEISGNRREALVELSELAYNLKDWSLCYSQAVAAIAIKDKPLDYLCEEFAWGALPYDLAAISAYTLGNREEAKLYGEEAARLEPNNKRLQENLKFY
jgi:glycosyltransferase involved in cell wall biosynthesis